MRIPIKCLRILVLSVALACFAGAAKAEPILIAHPGVKADKLDANEVRKIFMGKHYRWDDGGRITLCTLGGTSGSKEFLETYIGKTPKQYFTFWKRAVFSGTGVMPKSFRSEREMIKFVSDTPGALGFIDESSPRRGVKVIDIH